MRQNNIDGVRLTPGTGGFVVRGPTCFSLIALAALAQLCCLRHSSDVAALSGEGDRIPEAGEEGASLGGRLGPTGGNTPIGRTLRLDFRSPLLTCEANSNFEFSMDQLFGRTGERLADSGAGDSAAGRSLLAALSFWSAGCLMYYSHEVAHDHVRRAHGHLGGVSLDWSDWSHLCPLYVQSECDYTLYDHDEVHRIIVGGLNQNEYNARARWQHGCRTGATDLQASASFLCGKLRDLAQVLSLGLEDERFFSPGMDIHLLVPMVPDHLWSDVDLYTLLLYNEGIDLPKRDYFIQVLLADLLSWHTWQSVAHVAGYVSTGRRARRVTVVRLWGVAVTPPFISHYLTPKGSFFDMSAVANPGGRRPVLLSVGTDVDRIGYGEVDRLRFGAVAYDLGTARVKIDPFVFVNTDRSLRYEGISCGVEVRPRLAPGLYLRLRLEYNENDVVENMVKGEKNGVGFVSGIEYRF